MLEKFGFNIIQYESVPYPLENSLVFITKKKEQTKSSILFNDIKVDDQIVSYIVEEKKIL